MIEFQRNEFFSYKEYTKDIIMNDFTIFFSISRAFVELDHGELGNLQKIPDKIKLWGQNFTIR